MKLVPPDGVSGHIEKSRCSRGPLHRAGHVGDLQDGCTEILITDVSLSIEISGVKSQLLAEIAPHPAVGHFKYRQF